MTAPSLEDLEAADALYQAGVDQFADIEEQIRKLNAATVGVTNEELITSAADADAFVVWAARQNVNVFCEYVLRDELTGKPHGPQEAHHVEWHGLAAKHDRLILWAFPEAGKSQQLSIGRTLWLLGNNPNLRLVIVSETHALAKKIVRAIGRYIETSDELRRVFPGLRPGKDAPWTETYIYVDRQTHGKDPSVQAFGVHAKSVQGSRVDGMIWDDILSPENTRTKAAREDLWGWCEWVQSRLTDGGFILAVGNAFHPDDVLHRLARNPRWMWRRFPVVTPEGKSNWPKRWPLERIDLKRRDMGGGAEFARQFLCQARSDEDARFKQAWIDLCLARGEGRTMVGDNVSLTPLAAQAADQLRAYAGLGARTYTGVDLAIQKHESADLTVFFTIRAHGNGDREVLEIFSGRMGAPEILAKMREVHSRYGSIMIVENNAAQDYIVQLVQSTTAIPVRGFTTGRNKAHPEFGIETLSNEMANAKWIIPNRAGVMHPEVRAWVDEMLYYDPAGHTGDRLMASWFAREGVRMGEIPVPVAETGRINW